MGREVYFSSFALVLRFLTLTLRVQDAPLRHSCLDHADLLVDFSETSQVVFDLKRNGVDTTW